MIAGISAYALIGAGCQSGAPQPTAAETPSPTTISAWERPVEAQRFVVDPDRSEVRLLVYRGGSLAALGHNHVISGRPEGEVYIGPTTKSSGFRVCLPLRSLDVDDTAKRTEEGTAFSADVPEAARNATRDNMLGDKQLKAAAHPVLLVYSTGLSGPLWNPDIKAAVSVAGGSSVVRLSAAVFRVDELMSIVARFRVKQSSLGIKPLSVLGGNLQVLDEIDVRVRLTAVADQANSRVDCGDDSAS